MQTISHTTQNGAVQRQYFLQPGYSRHIIRHKNAYISVNREKQTSANLNSGEPHETVTLTTLYSHRYIFEDIFTEAHHLATSTQEGKTVMFTSHGIEWARFGDPRLKRPLQSVILDEGIKERILTDVKDFIGRKD
jgi:chaperone BCS1